MKNANMKPWIIGGIALLLLGTGGMVYLIARGMISPNSVEEIALNMRLDSGEDGIDWSSYPTYKMELSKSQTITEAGVYYLSGTVEDGILNISVSDNVKLVLDGVNIKNSNGPAILISEAKNVVIFTIKDSVNVFEDGAIYSGYADDEIGTIFSHDDLILSGEGILKVISNTEDAIVGKDDLQIISGTYSIVAADDGIRGKDSVHIVDGDFNINASGDGIKSTNTAESDKGFVYIENGDFVIDVGFDGIQAETELKINNGTFDIKTGNGSASTSSITSGWGTWSSPNTTTISDSAKAIKAGNNLVILDGDFNIDSADDAVHSNNYVGIQGGSFTIASGDDGIHADNELLIDGGAITISKSYEGLEATSITINDGEISIIASDDGINAAGGNDGSSMNRPGANQHVSDDNGNLTINGGKINVNSSGDGLDSNGNIYQNGGEIIVYGPTSNMDGALDYDGSYIITSGTLLAGSANGMLQGISQGSSINSVIVNFNGTVSAGQNIVVEDTDGNTVVSYKSTKAFSTLVIASPELEQGKTYIIKIDDEIYTNFTVSGVNTTVGNGGMMPGGMRGGMR